MVNWIISRIRRRNLGFPLFICRIGSFKTAEEYFREEKSGF
jgi:hypothetical protein